MPLGGHAADRNRPSATAPAEEAVTAASPGSGWQGSRRQGFGSNGRVPPIVVSSSSKRAASSIKRLSFGVALALRAVAADESGLGLNGGDIGETAVNLAEPVVIRASRTRLGWGLFVVIEIPMATELKMGPVYLSSAIRHLGRF